jgi:Iron-containing redox enzyme
MKPIYFVLVDQLVQPQAESDYFLETIPGLADAVHHSAITTADLAFRSGNKVAEALVHRVLSRLISLRFSRTEAFAAEQSYQFYRLQTELSKRFVECELQSVCAEAQKAPRNEKDFVEWFFHQCDSHPAGNHKLYDYLKNQASFKEFSFWVLQETTVDGAFDDVLSQAQTGVQGSAKLEFHRNIADEMGNGNPERVHTTMFAKLQRHLGIKIIDEKNHLTESLACGNLMSILSLYRSYYHHCIGYLGVTEALAPRRFQKVVFGGKRLKISPEVLAYHVEHCSVDEDHTQGWLTNVIASAIKDNPDTAVAIAEGVLMRLNLSQRYCDALLEAFQSSHSLDFIEDESLAA